MSNETKNKNQEEKEKLDLFSQKNMKRQASTYAAAMLLSVSAAGLAGCSSTSEQSFEDCLDKNDDAEVCLDLLEDDDDGGSYTSHTSGGFFYFGGVYSDSSGKYHGGSGKYSHSKYDKSVGKTKYSSVRAKGGSASS